VKVWYLEARSELAQDPDASLVTGFLADSIVGALVVVERDVDAADTASASGDATVLRY
jgi:hypothetical protein